MQAILSETLPLTPTPKWVKKKATQLTLIYLKAPRLKNSVIALVSYSVLRIRNDQCKHFKCGFTPDSNTKMGKKGVTILFFFF